MRHNWDAGRAPGRLKNSGDADLLLEETHSHANGLEWMVIDRTHNNFLSDHVVKLAAIVLSVKNKNMKTNITEMCTLFSLHFPQHMISKLNDK